MLKLPKITSTKVTKNGFSKMNCNFCFTAVEVCVTFLSPARLSSHRPPGNVLFVQKSSVRVIAWKRLGCISSSILECAAFLLGALPLWRSDPAVVRSGVLQLVQNSVWGVLRRLAVHVLHRFRRESMTVQCKSNKPGLRPWSLRCCLPPFSALHND